jgi:hypothetical protein
LNCTIRSIGLKHYCYEHAQVFQMRCIWDSFVFNDEHRILGQGKGAVLGVALHEPSLADADAVALHDCRTKGGNEPPPRMGMVRTYGNGSRQTVS